MTGGRCSCPGSAVWGSAAQRRLCQGAAASRQPLALTEGPESRSGGRESNLRAGTSLCALGGHGQIARPQVSMTLNALRKLLPLEPPPQLTIKFRAIPSLGVSLFLERLFVSLIQKEALQTAGSGLRKG